MKSITALFFLLINLSLFAQEKKAVVFAPASAVSINEITPAEALEKQGFSNEIIRITPDAEGKAIFMKSLTASLQSTQKGNFLLLYFYQPVIIHQPENEAVLLFDATHQQYISFSELGNLIKTTTKKINDPNSIFCIFDGDLSAVNNEAAKKTFTRDAISLNGIFATQPGETNSHSGKATLFTNSFSEAITSGSSFITTYQDLLQRIENNIILHSAKQLPLINYTDVKSSLFNNRFLKSPVFLSVNEQSDNNTVIINAGQNLTILPGTIINFYPALSMDTAKKLVTTGLVIASNDLTATVKLSKPYADARKLWAFASWNENEDAAINPLTFNTHFPQTENAQKNKYFEAIVNGIKEDPRLQQYVKFVTTGGDLQISTIGLMSKDSISCTVVNPRTGQPLKDFYYAAKTKDIIYSSGGDNKYSEVGEYLVNSAEWQYLSKLHNCIPELQTDVSIIQVNSKGIQKENGDPVVYENDELKLVLHNPHSKKIYFSIIALRTDKSIKLVYPGIGEEASTYQLLPGQTFTSESIIVSAVFGLEKLKIITSTTPVEVEELRGKNILTRKKENTSSFFPENVNIQDFDYEIRNRLYAGEKSGKKIQLLPIVTDKKITIKNPSAEKIFLNILLLAKNGEYTCLFPNNKLSSADCSIDPLLSSTFNFESILERNDQLITVYADRPFLLSHYQSDNKTINDLLVDILRTGRLPGTPLNKISLQQQLFTEKTVIATRGTAIVIKLISPKITPDKGLTQQALTDEYTINGFALTEENNAVKTVKINGEEVAYDKSLKFFDKIIQLEPGNNKIVIEAIDEKGFTESKILDVLLPPKNTDLPVKGTNYFLGIGIDKYQIWPPLFNARNDVDSLSKLLQTKFGYQPANIKTLLDSAASRKNIIKQIRTFLVSAKPTDNIIIYFSGHGNKDQLSDGDYYFIPSDGEADDISSNVKSTDIMDNFKNIKAKHCLLIMDACFSGLISNSINKQQISVGNANKNPADLPSKWIITSGRATKVSDGIPGTNSPFAAVMLNYLKDNTDESKLTINKLIEYLKDNVPKFNKQQIPFGTSISGEGELTFKIAN